MLVVLATGLTVAACGGSSSSTTSSTTHTSTPAAASHRAVPSRPRTLAYRRLYSLAGALQDPGTAALGAGRFVLLGGLDAADSSTSGVIVGTTSAARQVASLPNRQHDAQAATLGGRVYLFGGGQFTEYDHILSFDPGAGTVSTAGALPRPSSDVAVAADGRSAYVVGGYDGVNSQDTILRYTPGSGTRVVGRVPVALRYAAVTMAGKAVIIVGGSTPAGTASSAIYRFNPATGQVRQIGSLPRPLTHAGVATLGGYVYVVGGRGSDSTSQTAAIWSINPTTGRVRAAGALPAPTSDAGVIGLGSAIVVAGGRTAAGTQSAVGELTPTP